MMKDLSFTGHKVLVTGAAGFIGSNLVEWLLDNGNSVVALDNYLTGKKENIEVYFNNENFKFIEGDICDLDTCHQACESVEYVLHQAALGSVPRSIKNPSLSTNINILGFVNMMFAAAEAKVKRFIYAASSSTYGDSEDLPKVEEKIGKPLSPYAISKYVNELHAENFSSLYGVDNIGLRYFNVFGRRQDPHGAYAAVIPTFISQLLNHVRVTINGDGYHGRDFTYIDNVIEANIRALIVEDSAAVNQVYNVAYGEINTLNALYKKIKSLLSENDTFIASLEPVFGPDRPGDIKESLASIEKAKSLLGYDPEYDLNSGLEKAINWYVEYFGKKK